ncbi:hypothetical protein GCM10023310_72220 [Paenibacillus vulneris]|uniref:DUF3990 domain-containing protein n=1 Tax=Paenibacillus vulneris TaxID=1133364 RepID=A0ABW3UI56_9BACL
MSDSYMKHLKKDKWYHGTTLEGWKGICEKGVLAAYNIGHELDFGYGFYLTPIKSQAEKFITTLLRVTKEDNEMLSEIGSMFSFEDNKDSKIAVVVEFDFTPLEWMARKDEYTYKILNAYDDEFAEFVFYNRTENDDGSKQHSYDYIFGVMSDSNPIIDIARYKNGEIGKEEVIESFKKSTSAKQLSIHNQKLCDIIKPSRAYVIDTGEELDINEYLNKRKQKFIGRSAI